MIFTSGTQALQGRTVNHDWIPFAFGEAGSSVRAHSGGIGYVYDARPEFAVLDNPILAQFRVDRNGQDFIDHEDALLFYLWALEGGDLDADGTPARLLQVDHARRVLTRLANWKEDNR